MFLVDVWQSVGMDLYQAVLKVDESLGLVPSLEAAQPEQPSSDIPSPADNDRALAELQRMMGGIR